MTAEFERTGARGRGRAGTGGPARYLQDGDDVTTAQTGVEALDRPDEGVDVALLDRRLPVMSGNEAVAHVEERARECRTAIVTAVNPEFDVTGLRTTTTS